jgi:acetoacetate decarboxylase
MHGQLWLSLFRVREGDHPERPAGVYGAALVSYERPSPLTYGELLVARPVEKKVSITDIWVDSIDSRDGGRELWAIPKDLCDFKLDTTGKLLQRTSWTASLDGRPIARARFTDVSRATLRTPFKGATWQVRDSGEEVVAHLGGSAKVLPCRSHWEFNDAGPLAWLAGKRPLASFRMADFQMSFG